MVFLIVSRLQAIRFYQEPEFEDIEDIGNDSTIGVLESHFPNIFSWQRPNVLPTVGLQVGHWKNNELPDELERLRKRGGGTRGGGKAEWEVSLKIAREAAIILQDQGIVVDILPATVPPSYWADVFIAIHADGSGDPQVSGFKVATTWRDYSGQGRNFVSLLEQEYQKATGLRIDQNVTHNMRGYYAFNWRHYEHAVHPMTTAVILETGFLTNPRDRSLLINNFQKPVQGIVQAVLKFFQENSKIPYYTNEQNKDGSYNEQSREQNFDEPSEESSYNLNLNLNLN